MNSDTSNDAIPSGKNMYKMAEYIGNLFNKKVIVHKENSVSISVDENNEICVHEGFVQFYGDLIKNNPKLVHAIEQIFDVTYEKDGYFANNGTW